MIPIDEDRVVGLAMQLRASIGHTQAFIGLVNELKQMIRDLEQEAFIAGISAAEDALGFNTTKVIPFPEHMEKR